MRTTLMNLPSRSLFAKQGFVEIPDVFQDIQGIRTDGSEKIDRRLFMIR